MPTTTKLALRLLSLFSNSFSTSSFLFLGTADSSSCNCFISPAGASLAFDLAATFLVALLAAAASNLLPAKSY